jgi:hypothetical protein
MGGGVPGRAAAEALHGRLNTTELDLSGRLLTFSGCCASSGGPVLGVGCPEADLPNVRSGSFRGARVSRNEWPLLRFRSGKQTSRLREEFRTLASVRKSPKNEPAVLQASSYGDLVVRLWWRGRAWLVDGRLARVTRMSAGAD